jgi:hypothetical protein
MNGEELFPFAEVELVDRGNGLDPGIRDEDVDPAERRDRLCDAGRRRRFIGDVDGDPDRPLGSAKLGGGRIGAPSLRSAIATLAPSRANSAAILLPMPLAAPVTSLLYLQAASCAPIFAAIFGSR